MSWRCRGISKFGSGPESLELIGYVDADDAGNMQKRTSMGGYVFLLNAGKPIVLHVDNKSAITVAEGLGLTGNLKHMERRYAWLQHIVRRGKFALKYIPTTEQPADFLAKALHFPAFNWCSVAIGQVCLANVGDVETLDSHLGLNQVYLEAKASGSSGGDGGVGAARSSAAVSGSIGSRAAGGGEGAATSKWVAMRSFDDGGLSALNGCPECRQPITVLRQYGRMVNKALLDQSDRKFALSCLADQQQLQQKLSQMSRSISACPEAAQPWQVWGLVRAATFLVVEASKLQGTAMEPPT
ncbi:unnamed protein product [Closterium sp. NIES-54]